MRDKEKFFSDADKLAGKIATVGYSKMQKLKKSAPENITIEKRSVFQVRVGIEYANQKAVQDGHESGEIQKIGLPECYEKLSRSRYFNKNRGVDVLACTPVDTNERKTTWLLNGEETDLESVKQYLYASSYKSYSSEKPKWITLDEQSIISLTGVS